MRFDNKHTAPACMRKATKQAFYHPFGARHLAYGIHTSTVKPWSARGFSSSPSRTHQTSQEQPEPKVGPMQRMRGPEIHHRGDWRAVFRARRQLAASKCRSCSVVPCVCLSRTSFSSTDPRLGLTTTTSGEGRTSCSCKVSARQAAGSDTHYHFFCVLGKPRKSFSQQSHARSRKNKRGIIYVIRYAIIQNTAAGSDAEQAEREDLSILCWPRALPCQPRS